MRPSGIRGKPSREQGEPGAPITPTPPAADGNEPILRDVTLRDGLQPTGKLLPVERKAEIVRRLPALGVPALEIGSMARPDLVPPMANGMELAEMLTSAEPATLDRLPRPRHLGHGRGQFAGRDRGRRRGGRRFAGWSGRLSVRARREREHPHRGPARPSWFTPETLAGLVALTDGVLHELGEPNRSRTIEGVRSKAAAFEWVVAES